MDGGVGEDINVVSDLYGHEVLGELDGAMFPELPSEHVARARSDTKGVRHVVLDERKAYQKRN